MSGTNERAAAGDGEQIGPSPAHVVRELRTIGERTSAAAHGYWLPLLLFAALICGSLPFYERLKARPVVSGPPIPSSCVPGVPCRVSSAATRHVTVVTALGYYWQIAILAGVVATVIWYRWRGDRVGLRTPSRAFLLTGLILGEAVLLVPLLIGDSQSSSLARLLHDTHQAGPLVIIAVLLWVLAWSERSTALAVITAVYIVVALLVSQYSNGGLAGGTTGAADVSLTALRLLGLLPALILLAGGLAAWFARQLHLRGSLV